MTRHPANRGRVLLSAWVEPTLRDYARESARIDGVEFSELVAEAVRREVKRRSAERFHAARAARRLAESVDACVAAMMKAGGL